MQKQTRTKKSPAIRRSRKLELAKPTQLTPLDTEQVSKVERFKRLYAFDQKLAKAGWITTTGGSSKYYATLEKDGLIKSLTTEQCCEFGVRNYSAEEAEIYADVSHSKSTKQEKPEVQSGANASVSAESSGAIPQVANHIEQNETVCSQVLRETIPAPSNVGACNVQKFLGLADGPIKFDDLSVFGEWSIRVISGDYGGATLYVIANDDWSDLACFTDFSAAKSDYIDKVIVSTRARICGDINNKLIQTPVPTASGKHDDDIPF